MMHSKLSLDLQSWIIKQRTTDRLMVLTSKCLLRITERALIEKKIGNKQLQSKKKRSKYKEGENRIGLDAH